MPIDQNFKNIPEDRRLKGTVRKLVSELSGDFTFIGMTFLRCEIAGFYGFRIKNTLL